ncbi:hypothetical protein [Aestuariivirga sp.]|uniref:hypothetical protein n=1 Tax=Aestuariivirga sp. TaxID=2650926 RepID=UPI0039E2DAEB
MTSDVFELAGMINLTIPARTTFRAVGRLAIADPDVAPSGTGFMMVPVDYATGTVVEITLADHRFQAFITEIGQYTTRFIITGRIRNSAVKAC